AIAKYNDAIRMKNTCNMEIEKPALMIPSCSEAERIMEVSPTLFGIKRTLSTVSVCGFVDCQEIAKLFLDSVAFVAFAVTAAFFLFFHFFSLRQQKSETNFIPFGRPNGTFVV